MLRLFLAALLIAASWSVPAQAVHRHHHRHHQIIRYDCSGPRGNMGCWIVRRASFMGGAASGTDQVLSRAIMFITASAAMAALAVSITILMRGTH